MPEREILDLDVLFVGAGPASLAGAIQLKSSARLELGFQAWSSFSSLDFSSNESRKRDYLRKKVYRKA